MSKQVYTVTKEGIEYLCGLINKIVTLPSDVIDNLNLADNTTFSSTKIDTLINQVLLDANNHAEELCNVLIKLTCEKTTVQPTLDNSELNIIYLYSANGNAPFEQYLKISETELIDMGSTSISLNNYLTATQIASTYAKKVDLDTLTTEVTNIKSDFNTHKDDTDIHVTKELKDKLVTTDDIVTTIDSLSTDDTIPSAKAVNTKIQEIYSTSEVKTNKVWINGKPIYRKIYTSSDFDFIDNVRQGVSKTNISNIEDLVNISGNCKTPSYFVPVNVGKWQGDTGDVWAFSTLVKPNGQIILDMGTSIYSAKNNIKIVVEYTKTTD